MVRTANGTSVISTIIGEDLEGFGREVFLFFCIRKDLVV